MSVLIKGVKKPKGCITCFCMSFDPDGRTMWCQWLDEPLGEWSKRGGKWRHPDCPLVEVPTPHGPMIDEDVFIREINERIDAAIKWGTNAIADRENETRLRAEQAVATFCEASLTARKMPTIIEAEEGEGHDA